MKRSCSIISLSLEKILQTMEKFGLTLVDMKRFWGERGYHIDADEQIVALGMDVDHTLTVEISEDGNNLGGKCVAMELRGVNSLKIVSDLAIIICQEGEDTNTDTRSFIAASNITDVKFSRGVYLQTNKTATTSRYQIKMRPCYTLQHTISWILYQRHQSLPPRATICCRVLWGI